jgi:adenine-specific DNA-methyltransferase
MQNLLNDLKACLQKDKRLVAGDRLLKNKIIELCLQNDPLLIDMLLSHEKFKKHFFLQAGKAWIFDKIRFQQFVNNKAFLPDSYTAFKNKIGLTDHDEPLLSSKTVILSWPYKDCMLEGGQAKEDKKRNENFINEVLAPDQIDRLLHPKAFTNIKKYTTDGVEIPREIKGEDNLIIRGNNLIALHSLKQVYSGKIKLIYIDPPYNTGSDSFLYNDSFNHSAWLTFMKNRLEAARELLSPAGCIFIQIDDTEFAYLKVLCDEIFGRENFRENIVLKSSTESGVNAVNVKRGERLFKVKENILFYAKSPGFRFKPFYTKTEYNTNYKYEVIKVRNQYKVRNVYKDLLTEKGIKEKNITKAERVLIEQEFITYCLENPENIYSLEKNIKKAGDKFKAFAGTNKGKNKVEQYINSAGETVLIYDGGVLVPLRERIIRENGRNYFGVLASDLWLDIGTTPATEGGIAFRNGKKPEKLLKRIIEMTTEKNDIILDYHLGSGTTAAVAHKLGRRYIGVEQLDYGENDSVVRLQHVIQGDQTGISKTVNWEGGGSFIYMELKKLNQFFLDKINRLKNKKEANALLKEIIEHGAIAYDIDVNAINSKANEFLDLNTADQKAFLTRLLDLNLLYLPYSEIEDKSYHIPTEEIQLNNNFYSLKIK